MSNREAAAASPDTRSLAQSGRSTDYINGYEAGWEAHADRAASAPQAVAAQPAASGVDALWVEQATKLELAIGASAFACGNWRTGDEPSYDTLYQRWAAAREALRTHLSTALTGAAKE